MATARAMLERRRSSRVVSCIPVNVRSKPHEGQPVQAPAEAVAVSRCGALLRVPLSPALGSRIEVRHEISHETQEFRVVRISPGEDGLYELGVEMLCPGHNFWGIPLPGERRTG